MRLFLSFLTAFIVGLLAHPLLAGTLVVDLRCEYVTHPLGIDSAAPQLSWRMESDTAGQMQTAYRIIVSSTPEKLDQEEGDLWDSGKVETDQSQHIKYGGGDLSSKMTCYWKVQVWSARHRLGDGGDTDGTVTPWSEPAHWVMGYLSPDDWTAKWIKAPEPLAPKPADIDLIKATYGDGQESIDVKTRVQELLSQRKKIVADPNTFKQDKKAKGYALNLEYELDGKPMQLVVNPKRTVDFSGESRFGKAAPHFRKEFDLLAQPESARITVNAAAYFEVYVNGQKVGKDVLTPAQSANKKRTFSVTYDLQPYLNKGPNCIGLWIGHWQGPFANPTIVRAQLDAVVNGEPFTLGTDATWLSRKSGRYTTDGGGFGGEWVDARRLIPNWSEPGLATTGWRAAVETSGFPGKVLNQNCPLNRLGEPIPVKTITDLGDGSYEIDFGTNLTGWFRMQMPQLQAGDQVTMTFADSKGNARQKGKGYQDFGQVSYFISAGKSGEVFQHQFNYAAFQYVIVKGLPEAPQKSDAVAMLVDSDLEGVGGFESSNDLLNRIFTLNEWTQRCLNLGGYSVDCPHRERKGYGGDGQTPIEGFLTGFRADGFYRKWLMDWKDVQRADGSLPNTAPQGFGGGGPAWGGFVAAATWKHYLYYGDIRILEENYDVVRKYVENMEVISAKNGDILTGKTGRFSFIGDWVAPGRGMESKNMPSHEAREIFNNCYRIYHMQLFIQMAQALGKEDVAAKYTKIIERIRPLIHEQFYNTETGTYVYDQQAYYILPLMTDVVPEELRAKVWKDLEHNILVTREGHLDTGLLGTYLMFEYLREEGRNDLAFTMFNKTTYPSWGYMLEQGATTVWEQWNGFWSHIHSCFPSANNWLYQALGGIQADPAGPGFKTFIIKPDVVGDLTWVKSHHDSPYGRIVSNWKVVDGKLIMEVVIPANTTATIYVPAKNEAAVSIEGDTDLFTFQTMEDGHAVHKALAGNYMITSQDFFLTTDGHQ
ncbi:MAG: family 78 glycoside hydrolase catalytic domain [Verrucomicrobiota bacterium]